MKIEEQKKIRERILRQKEERRKQAAKKLAAEHEYDTVITPIELLKKPDVQKILPAKPEETSQKVAQNRKPPSNSTGGPRTNPNNIQIQINNGAGMGGVRSKSERANNFLCNRTVIAKDDSLMDSSIVVVNNLAAGTSEIKLRKLCQGVGDIQVRVFN